MTNKIMDNEMENVVGGAANGAQYYIIQNGDTLSGIAQKFGTTVEVLLALNPRIKNKNLIYAGDRIRVR